MKERVIESAYQEALSAGVVEMGLQISKERQESLLAYIALLDRWNQAYNLTAVRNQAEMIPRHLLDSLSVSPYIWGERVIDVGTGPGLPGIPLAIIYPQIQFTLLDSNGKKIRFVRQAVMELGLKNVQAEQARVENYRPPDRFDMVITRAFAALQDILDLTAHLLSPTGQLMAMKARRVELELAASELQERSVQLISLQVPQLAGERYIVLLEGNADK